ncbi:MAG: efflux RND transporter permease subunit [Myxococcales bacterium]
MLLVAIAVGVMAVGIVQLRNAPVDVLPEFTPPYVEVQTESLGLSANEVEQLMTVPLEADLLNGVQGIDVIRSESVPGLSDIVMVFDDQTSLYEARQLVQERLIQAHALPNVSRPPTMINPLSSSSRVMMIGLDPKKLSPIEASVLARWTVKPSLLGVPGVANVAIWGSRDRQLQVQVSPKQLENQDIKLSQVIDTTGNAQLVSPLTFLEASTPGTGGFIETPNQRLQVRHVFENLTTPEGLGQVPVDGTDGKMRLDDVANVVDGHPPLIGNAIVDGNSSGLLLVVDKFPGADTAEVTAGVQDALNKLKPGLSGMKFDTNVFRPTAYIEEAVGNLTLALVVAGILLALALAAFLFQWRTVLISLIAIPLSLVAAAFVAYLLGQTFNPILFAGLAAAIAVVVDDAVVGAHNVLRRLREHRQEEGDDGSTADVVVAAYTEVRSPTTYATLIALLAIVPVVVMGGRPGAFFEPLTLSYVLAVLASMIVALTVAPALSLLLFSWGSPGRRESPILRRLSPRYDGALSRLVRAPRAALVVCGVLVVAGLGALPLLDASVIPSFKDRDVLVRLEGPPGTSESKMSATTSQLGSQLKTIPGVEDVGATVGRAVTGNQIVDVNSSELSVRLSPSADYDSAVASIEDVVGRAQQDVQGSVETYSDQALRDVGALYTGEQPTAGNGLDVLTGVHEPLVVRIYGQDLGVLRSEAEKVRGVVSGVDGVVDPRFKLGPEKPVIDIETKLSEAAHYGLKSGDIRRAEAALVQGIQVGSIFRGQKVFEVVVLGEPAVRESVASVRNMLIDTPGGGHVRLGQVADVRTGSSPTDIKREAVSRYVDVKADVSGRSLATVTGDVNARLANVKFPLEYHAAVLGQTTTGQEINLAAIVGFGVVVVIAIFLLFQAALRSWRLAALVFLTLPVALAGGALAALIDGAALPLGALIAFLAIVGLAARNGTMLIHNCQRLRTDAAHPFGADLVRRGAGERLAPVLTSASTLALVALPFVIMGNVAGLEIVNPMAIVLLGGLITTTLLSLFVLPVLYLRFGAGAQPEPLAETSLAPGEAAAEPAYRGREAAAKRFRRTGGAAERQADVAQQEGAQGERRSE